MKNHQIGAATLVLLSSVAMAASPADFRRQAANMLAFEANRGQSGVVTAAISRDAGDFLTYVQGAIEAYDLQGLVCTPSGVSVGAAATRIAREIVSNDRTADQSPAVQVFVAASVVYACKTDPK